MVRFRTWVADRNFEMMHLEQMRTVIKRSRELLASNPVPDTFVGRQTKEPFPQEEDDRAERWMASKELQPPN